jgi:glyoxylase-like metal-dependent hydrolase (beta-lactamase superfamily II)
MNRGSSRPAVARADKVLPGLWRIRLPLPWPATPHGNAYAVQAGDGIVLFDTGYGGTDGLRQLELGLAQAGFRLDDISLIVCTHAHADHFGAAASIIERTGVPIWIHPAWEHARPWCEDPDAALDARLDNARRNGVPAELTGQWEAERRGKETGFDGPVVPDRDLVPGVEVETDLGTWQTHFTPGHAPSHVVLHQPERRLLISGDMIVGKVFLFFDHGHTPDPVGEFLSSLDVVAGLDVGLCISGHGRPIRDIPARVPPYREAVEQQLGDVRRRLTDEPRTAYEIVLAGAEGAELPPMAVGYALEMTLSYLEHLALGGEAALHQEDDLRRWVRK